jgi:hypothetical protein
MAGARVVTVNRLNDVLTPDVATPEDTAPEDSTPDAIAQLALLVRAANPGGLSGVNSEYALRVIEAAEAVKAWADSIAVDATAAMVREFETEWVHLAPESPSTRGWTRFVRHCRSAAAREIQVATGLPITQCQRRVWLAACEPGRISLVLEQMRLGHLTLARATTLAQATAHLDAFTAAAIAGRVLATPSSPDGSPLPGSAPLSQATFTARLHRQLVLHQGPVAEAERRYAEAVRARRVWAEPHPDGTGTLLIGGDGSRICAARSRVDHIARRLRGSGDIRTLDQLRADVATDLLMHGWIPDDPTFAALGKPPTATVQLIVSLPTLLGIDRGTGLIPGLGAINSQQARELALTAGSIWSRVVTDPLTGRAIEATAATYKVPSGMAVQVRVRDGVCRAPGCEIPAGATDLDHSAEWQSEGAGGPTSETNVVALHRGHHNLKTAGFWDSEQSADGSLRWTTAAGRTITTYPYRYEHPDYFPIASSTLETRLGTQLALVLNPDIRRLGHFSVFDEMDLTGAPARSGPATEKLPPHLWPHLRRLLPAPASTGSTPRRSLKRQSADLVAATSGPPPF